MNDDKRPLLLELAYLVYKRNTINNRRFRASQRMLYYKNIKEVVHAHDRNSYAIKGLKKRLCYARDAVASGTVGNNVYVEDLETRLEHEYELLDSITRGKECPKKWIGRLSEINKLILKNHADYVRAKYDTARFTYATRKRVSFLAKQLNVRVVYDNGYIDFLYPRNEKNIDADEKTIIRSEFKSLAREHEAAVAVENMLEGKYDKKKCSKESISTSYEGQLVRD